jgi:hypothetical protein
LTRGGAGRAALVAAPARLPCSAGCDPAAPEGLTKAQSAPQAWPNCTSASSSPATTTSARAGLCASASSSRPWTHCRSTPRSRANRGFAVRESGVVEILEERIRRHSRSGQSLCGYFAQLLVHRRSARCARRGAPTTALIRAARARSGARAVRRCRSGG